MDIQIDHLDVCQVCKENFTVRLFKILDYWRNVFQQYQVFEIVLVFS